MKKKEKYSLGTNSTLLGHLLAGHSTFEPGQSKGLSIFVQMFLPPLGSGRVEGNHSEERPPHTNHGTFFVRI